MDYGAYEGLTTAQIRATVPGWTVWSHPCPGGESAEQVGERADEVLERYRARLDVGDVVLVGHGHFSRALTARWLSLPASAGVDFQLESVDVPSVGVGIILGGGNGWNGPPNCPLWNGATWLCSRYGYDQTRARFIKSTPNTSPALVGQTRMPSPKAKWVALVRREISKATRFCG